MANFVALQDLVHSIVSVVAEAQREIEKAQIANFGELLGQRAPAADLTVTPFPQLPSLMPSLGKRFYHSAADGASPGIIRCAYKQVDT